MKLLLCALVCAMAGCAGGAAPRDVPGTTTSGGTTGDSTMQCMCSDDVPDSGVNCDPGSQFCDGAQVWNCTRTGHDAVLAETCPGSTNNPGVCGPSDGGVTCGRAQPTCVATLTAPTADATCTWLPPTNASCDNSVLYSVTTFDTETCSPGQIEVGVYTSKHSAGDTITLPDDWVIVDVSYDGHQAASSNCAGTLEWLSDVPTPKFNINVNCAIDSTGDFIPVQATMSGEL